VRKEDYHMQDDAGEMRGMKDTDPKDWCKYTLLGLEAKVIEYNKVARKIGDTDVIVAFSMTEKEEEEFLGQFDEVVEDEV
jgi:hypothetical protein